MTLSFQLIDANPDLPHERASGAQSLACVARAPRLDASERIALVAAAVIATAVPGPGTFLRQRGAALGRVVVGA
jgi:hypothetical protein